MAKPTEGNVIEPSVPADVSEYSLEDACKLMTDAGITPRRLTVGPDDMKYYADSTLLDMARKFGLTLRVHRKYEYSEWTVDDMKSGKGRNTFWSPGAGA